MINIIPAQPLDLIWYCTPGEGLRQKLCGNNKMLKSIFSIVDRLLGKCLWYDRGNETQLHLINWTETQTEISPAPHNMKLLLFKGYVVFSPFCIQDTSTLLQHCLFAGLWWGVCLLLTYKSYMPCQYNADSSVTDDQPYLFSSYLEEQSNSLDKPM